MVRTSAETAAYLRNLTVQVQNGSMSKSEAKRRAILAIQEVAVKEPEQVASEGEGSEAPQPEVKKVPAIDPKTRILSLLTQFEESIQSSLKKLEHDVTSIVKETSDSAVPLGDFNIGNDVTGGLTNSAKITIEAGDKPAQVLVTYNLKKAWNVDGIMLPVQASAPKSCHIPLRQELLALCSDVREGTESELSWKRNKKSSLADLSHIETLATTSGDNKVLEIVSGKPSDELADSWKKWATSAQVYLIGTDWSEGCSFKSVTERI